MKKQMVTCLVLAAAALASTTAYANLLTENFEGAAFPPAGWTWEGINVQPYTWHQATNAAEGASWPTSDGSQFALTVMPYNHLGVDDWLVSPVLNTTGDVAVGGLTLGSQQQYSWGSYDLELWVINGDVINDGDDVRVGSVASFWGTGAWHWVSFELDLSDYYTPGQDFRIGFRQLQISQCNTSALDGIYVTPEPASFALLALGGLLAIGRRRG
jgi:hypothetical protein